VDVRIDEIVLRALERTPELRFQTAVEFRAQVQQAARASIQPAPWHVSIQWLAFGCGLFSGLVPLVFYFLAPWLTPWLNPTGSAVMLWLSLALGVLAVGLGALVRTTWQGRKACIMGSIAIAFWLLFLLAAQFSEPRRPLIKLWPDPVEEPSVPSSQVPNNKP
jgi:hypothetical protein